MFAVSYANGAPSTIPTCDLYLRRAIIPAYSAEWSRTASASADLRSMNRLSRAARSSRFKAIIFARASPPRMTSKASYSIPSMTAAATAPAGSRVKPSSGPARDERIIGVSVAPG
jgi:hypothetical protein